MFGYVLVNHQMLCPEAAARYQASYCGLCHTLGDAHGSIGRLALSYDLTFLNLLLASLYQDEHPTQQGKRRCMIHPIGQKDWRTSHESAYCADVSIALHYYAAKDKWLDDKSVSGLAFMHLLEQKRKVVEQRYPIQCEAIATCLAQLSAFEAENAQDIEAVSDCFGNLMAALFVYQQDHWANDLRDIGFYLGKYIYLMDAYDDLEKDQKKGSYNPLNTLSQAPDFDELIGDILQDLMGRCARLFERLPCIADHDILENILYSGVWMRYAARKAKRTGAQDTPPTNPESAEND